MATYGRSVRRGLPRVAGGEPWPAVGDAPVGAADSAAPAAPDVPAAQVAVPAASAPDERHEVTPAPPVTPAEAVRVAVPAASAPDERHEVTPAQAAAGGALRRGLPRVPGGEPWPPAGVAASGAAPVSVVAGVSAADRAEVTLEQPAQAQPTPATAPVPAATTAQPPATGGDELALRRGLPRVEGGEPWPPAGVARSSVTPAPATDAAPVTDAATAGPATAGPATAGPATAGPATAGPATAGPATAGPATEAVPTAAAPAPAPATPAGPRPPLTVPRTVWPGASASVRPAPKPEPTRIGPFTRTQWAGVVVVVGGGLLVAAALAVFFVRWFLSLEFMQEFLVTYPGEYHLPEGAPVGFPAWLGWQHFFNAFFMVLIIRTGLQIRTEKRPAVFWTPRGDKKGKTSLTIWLHQALDILWMVNGLVFLVLLFTTGQWMRIVPTSWEVFPNALSAVLQYISLDWPTENGWVNYNSIQQLAYFTTVFIAAPLAAITGFRMSGMWPKKNARLNQAYPVEWARALHFPVMLYFVAFIIVHVSLVFATGALRNLNHMYAAQGSVDPSAYADNWTGFWIFIASIVVIAVGWIAARPLVVAPIARLFGTVSGR